MNVPKRTQELINRKFNGALTDQEALELAASYLDPLLAMYKLNAEMGIKGIGRKSDYLDGMEYAKNQMRVLMFFFKDHQNAMEFISAAHFLASFADATLTPGILLSGESKVSEPQKTYIVYNPKTRLIKIGKSVDVKSRISTISTMAGSILEVIKVFDDDIESTLHSIFSGIRQHGEWFSDDGSIRDYVNGLGNWTVQTEAATQLSSDP